MLNDGIWRWDSLAALRKDQIESGADTTFNSCFVPFYRGCSIDCKSLVDIGCGTGHLIRALGVQNSVGIEPAPKMYETALSVTRNMRGVRLYNCLLEDVELNEDVFDLCVCHLVLNSVCDLGAFIDAMRRVLAKVYVLTIPHPCFWYQGSGWELPESYLADEGRMGRLTVGKDREVIEVPYVHRPVMSYVNCLTKSGLLINRMVEHDVKKHGVNSVGWAGSVRYLSIFAERARL